MQEKQCTACKEIKPFKDFYKSKLGKYGLLSQCKICRGERIKKWRQNNPQRIEFYQAKSRENPPDRSEYFKEYAKNNPEKQKARSSRAYERYKKDKPDILKGIRKRSDLKRIANPVFKLSKIFSCAIYQSLKRKKDGYRWENLVNYTLQDLIPHLEKQFKPGMSWDNQGKWHIDHIIPKSLFKFESYNDREFRQCWALCNLQPLWAADNLRKHNKVA